MSKCGQEAKIDAVESVEIVPIDNVGGCDYDCAKFAGKRGVYQSRILNLLPRKMLSYS
jgi:hypothetical protein